MVTAILFLVTIGLTGFSPDLQKHDSSKGNNRNWMGENGRVNLIVSTFDQFETKFGAMKDVTMCQYYDAETGEHLATTVTGKAPDGFESPVERHKKS